ncbi:triose-phosphate isomerase [Litorilituus lipolyticus]|uniref:Triosephosphate isomerase n=1 Tax=Litorilituus lipolyticus TaxID=2491017 RepID=A0A502KSR1_9GAMM|nr:triose-phosphate isomerase [Litorilituus lipolyticus]TPH14622.1 triose-phosphate isomerase [Litorilituus lipolyticus]
MTRRAIVAANWKMNGNSALVNTMVTGLSDIKLAENVDVVICPSFPYLSELKSELSKANVATNLFVGSQNVSEHDSGAFTGEVSTNMLKELSVNYVIVGHSERRSLYKETSTQVAHKVNAALNAGLTPILCIGESESERATEQTETVLASQLQPVIDEVGIEKFVDVVIAYEPVWAIGTGKTASSEMAQETHQFIRQFLAQNNELVAAKVPLLYGGSVNATNCEELFAQADIDGGLIGGASLKVEQFSSICLAAKGK